MSNKDGSQRTIASFDDIRDYLSSMEIAENQYAISLNLSIKSHFQAIDLSHDCLNFTYGSYDIDPMSILPDKDGQTIAFAMMERLAMQMIAITIDSALESVFLKQNQNSDDVTIANASKISRILRNAFAHNPYYPRWNITNPNHLGVFEIPSIIRIDTTQLNGLALERAHFGGDLNLYFFSRFIRDHLRSSYLNDSL